jgi:hypothetical protein
MAIPFYYEANSYITFTSSLPQPESLTSTLSSPLGLHFLGSLGPGDLATTLVLEIQGLPTTSPPVDEVKRVAEALRALDGIGEVEIQEAKRRVKRGGEL